MYFQFRGEGCDYAFPMKDTGNVAGIARVQSLHRYNIRTLFLFGKAWTHLQIIPRKDKG